MNYDVIVVGAGPVGLFLAIELATANVWPLVIERFAAPDQTIKAGAFGAMAAEAMERRGMSKAMDEAEAAALAKFMPMMQAAAKDGFASFMSQNRGSPFKKLGGHFSGLFMIDQSIQKDPDRRFRGIVQADLEKILAARVAELGIEVRRGVEMTGFDEVADGIDVHVSGHTLRAKYLVGCDGGRSNVRKLAGIEFPGTDPTFTGWQAIAEVDHPEKIEKLRWTRTPKGVVTFGPVPGRIFVLDFDGPPADRNAPVTREDLEAALQKVSGTDVRILSVQSMTRFTDNARQATTYQKGRVLLAGDAAHVHSPFGGQGINLGLADAANLGWKLARTVRGTASEGLLATYTQERHPIGERVLLNTRAQTALMRPDALTTALRQIVADVMNIQPANQYFGEMLSGVATRYDLGDDDPRVGTLVSNLELDTENGPQRLFSFMQEGDGVLFGPSDNALRVAEGRVKVIHTKSGPTMLIRPDGCIARIGDEIERLRDALYTWFGAHALN